MGHLIATGVEEQGHQISFEYVGKESKQRCFALCNCGWKVEIESFLNPWSVIEVKVRVARHFEEVEIHPRNAAAHAIFSFSPYSD